MAEAEAEAKQLDSVTDMVAEQTVDETKAQAAMSALSSVKESTATKIQEVASIVKEDVELIMSELDVTEDVARKTLHDVAVEKKISKREDDALVKAALQKLVTS